MNRNALRGSLLLLLGAVIWGAAFVAQRAGMDHLQPFTFSGIRMLLGALVLWPVSVWTGKRRAGKATRVPEPPQASVTPQTTATPQAHASRRIQRKAGLLCGIFLFFATSLQQVGLVYTGAGKAGFITALYVVLVPVAGLLLFRIHPGRIIWGGVALAVGALYLLCVPAGGFRIEGGDALLIGCAICFTGQILCVDRFAARVDGITLSRDEFLVTGVLSTIVALFTETVTREGVRGAMIPILYTGILSCGVGYTMQVLGQRDVSATVASLLMCMESVFAVLTGVILLGESMSGREAAGCVMMFIAVILAQVSPLIQGIKQRKTRRGGI